MFRTLQEFCRVFLGCNCQIKHLLLLIPVHLHKCHAGCAHSTCLFDGTWQCHTASVYHFKNTMGYSCQKLVRLKRKLPVIYTAAYSTLFLRAVSFPSPAGAKRMLLSCEPRRKLRGAMDTVQAPWTHLLRILSAHSAKWLPSAFVINSKNLPQAHPPPPKEITKRMPFCSMKVQHLAARCKPLDCAPHQSKVHTVTERGV